MRVTLGVAALAAALIASGIHWKQRQAASCPLHRRYAGILALGLAGLLWGGAIVCAIGAMLAD